MGLHTGALRVVFLVFLVALPGSALASGAATIPLVTAGQDQSQHAGGQGAAGLQALGATDDADDDVDLEDGTERRWFALWFPDEFRPELQDKWLLIAIFGGLFGLVGGSVWAPILLAGASFDLEWALPSIIYNVVALCFLALGVAGWAFPYIGWYFGWVLFLAMQVVAWGMVWLAVQAALANLNRPDIELRPEKALGGTKPNKGHKPRGKVKRRPRPEDEAEEDDGADIQDGG